MKQLSKQYVHCTHQLLSHPLNIIFLDVHQSKYILSPSPRWLNQLVFYPVCYLSHSHHGDLEITFLYCHVSGMCWKMLACRGLIS